jgi:hypothetical protein
MAAALPEGTRKSDRWITPGVIIAAIVTTGLAIRCRAGRGLPVRPRRRP